MKTNSISLRLVHTILKTPFMLYGILLVTLGGAVYVLGNVLSIFRLLFALDFLKPVCEFIVWYSGMPFTLGVCFCLFDIFVLLPRKRRTKRFNSPIEEGKLTVALTAYNDEESIAPCVKDFLSHPKVDRVIVVSNNSSDDTEKNAKKAGAIVYNEEKQGYGHCVYRCLTEAMKCDNDLIMLSEGDGTFIASDIDKFLAYLPHSNIINGTRIVEQLREYDTQLSSFMFFGNMYVAKLLETKHFGKGTFTDVGTTYKLCTKGALERLLPKLNPEINMSFNAHFLDKALQIREVPVECPITFHKRVGISKGGNVNNIRALSVGLEMIKGLVFGWKKKHE